MRWVKAVGARSGMVRRVKAVWVRFGTVRRVKAVGVWLGEEGRGGVRFGKAVKAG